MSLINKLTKKPEGEVVENTSANSEKKLFEQGLVTTKDVIAPASLEVDFNYLRIDNKYYRTLFVAAYPRFVGMNWLSSLINFDATVTVSMYIYPTDGKAILDDLRRKITEMEAEMSSDIQRGRLVNPATQAKLEDAMNLQADLVKGEERFFQFGLYITMAADTKEEIDRTNKNLEAALGSLLIVSKRATLQMEDGFITTLPAADDRLNINRNMDTTSLATTFPFVSSDLSDDKGIMYGINAHNGSLVIFDRFSMQNYNSVVFATAGAGKSYMIKLEVLRSLMLGTEIIVIDPENEYRDLAEAVGGQYIAFGYGEASKINPFDLSLVEEEGENALNSKILSIHRLLKVMLGGMDPIEESILDKAMMDAYKMKGITPDPATQTREAPLIEDLYKSLIGMEDEKAKSLSARLEKYIKGSFAGIFNQKTTVNLTNPFVVFGIKNLEETLRPVAMHIILDYIWTVVKKTLKKRILVVDEAWYLMQFEDSAAFLRGIVKRGRKYYLGVTTITQDVDDFLATPYGKEIVTNSAIQILLKQHSAAIEQLGQVFYLSEGEKQLLLTAEKGQGIFFAGQNHVAINVISSEDEHKLITSNPEEVMKKQEFKKLDINKKIEESKLEQQKTGVVPPKPIEIKNEIKPKVEVKQNPPAPPANSPSASSGLSLDPLSLKATDGQRNAGLKPVENVREIKPSAVNEIKPKVEVITDTLHRNIPITEEKKLPPLPKFEPPKAEVVTSENKMPVFIKNEEVKIPQPPQLIKKSQPIFEAAKIEPKQNLPAPSTNSGPSSPTVAGPSFEKGGLSSKDLNVKEEVKPEVDKPKEEIKKDDYDKLFGNGIV